MLYKSCVLCKHNDSISLKSVFTDEANEEIDSLMNDKKYFLNLDGTNSRSSEHDCIMALYALTNVLNTDKGKLKQPVFN